MEESLVTKPSQGEPWDVVIIGSGPAGLTAAVYTTRGAHSTLILGGEKWGGQLMLTTTVDNYPGFPEGIEGPDLMQKMRKQAERFGSEFVESNVTAVDFNKTPFTLTTSKQSYLAKSVIIATGAETRWLGAPGEEKLRGRGVSSCAPCDAPFFKNKQVIVIGGGDSAMEEAHVLTKYATSVTIIHRKPDFRASAAMQKKALSSPKVKKILNSQVTEFKGDQVLQSVTIKNNKDNTTSELATQGAFVAIGHIPSSKLFTGQVDLDEKGFVKRMPSGSSQMLTSTPGVYTAGDIHDFHYKQAVTAAGFGCQAAMEAISFLDSQTGLDKAPLKGNNA